MPKSEHADGLSRCPWPGEDPLYVAYHDEEWGVPEFDDRALYEKLMLDGFQAGLSWITILRKRDNFRRAFDGFEPQVIAGYAPKKLHALMQDAGIVRNRAKIEGAVASARAYLDVMEKGPGFAQLLWDFMDGRPKVNRFRSRSQVPAETPLSRAISKELSSRGFKFCGPTIVYAFMQAVGMVNDHLVKCHRHAACAELGHAACGEAHSAKMNSDLVAYPPPQPLPRKGEGAQPVERMNSRPTKTRVRAGSPRAWQRMLSGRRLDLLDPSPLDVEIEDIAHGLARVARWNGQTHGAHIFSVAQHSLLVEAMARARVPRLDRRMRLAILLHDAPEYVVGDMISPFKAVIGDSYKAVEARLMRAIHLRFGLPAERSPEANQLLKAADQAAAYLEATKLAGFAEPEARRFFGQPPAIAAATARDYLVPWPAEKAESRYLTRFSELIAP